MIHYHGTPCGGERAEAAKFLRGRHAFIPFPRPEDIGAAAEACRSFAVDNGAFSVWKQGGTLDVAGYIRWCEEWHRHPGFDWAIVPDVIEGSEAENDALIADWPRDINGVPVWHMHESLERLEKLSHEWPRIALGSSGRWPTPGRDGWWQRMAEAMHVLCDEQGRPRCKLHGLRMLDPAIFHSLPLSSADSTNAVRNGNLASRFGMYCPPTHSQRLEIIASRIEHHQSAAIWRRDEQTLLTLDSPSAALKGTP